MSYNDIEPIKKHNQLLYKSSEYIVFIKVKFVRL